METPGKKPICLIGFYLFNLSTPHFLQKQLFFGGICVFCAQYSIRKSICGNKRKIVLKSRPKVDGLLSVVFLIVCPNVCNYASLYLCLFAHLRDHKGPITGGNWIIMGLDTFTPTSDTQQLINSGFHVSQHIEMAQRTHFLQLFIPTPVKKTLKESNYLAFTH